MKVYEIYCNDDKEYFFVTHESGQAFMRRFQACRRFF